MAVIRRKRKAKDPVGRGILYAVFGIFFIVGGAIALPLTVMPWKMHLASAEWERVPCRVLSAEVRSHRGSKGGHTYSVDVSFAYERDGRERRSDNYSFFTGSSSGRSSKEARVREILADPAPTCLVDPADPDNAVFTREIGALAILTLVPLVFVLVGGVGLLATFRASLRAAAAPPAARGPGSRIGVPPAPPVRARDGFHDLSAAGSPLPLFIVLALFALGWNGVVGVALHALATGAFDDASLFAGLFLVPFVLAGIALLGLAAHAFLSLFNPRLRLALSAGRLLPGEEFTLRWAIDRPGRVAKLALTLELRETVVTWGTDHSYQTRTRVLASLPVVETTQAREIARGDRRALIPADADPVVSEPERKIAWHLKVAGEIPKWPDLALDFELPVAPSAAPGDEASR